MKIPGIALLVAAWCLSLANLSAEPVIPPKGSPDRTAICDAARAYCAGKLRLPVEEVLWKISRIEVDGDQAYLNARPVTANGNDMQAAGSYPAEFRLKRGRGGWEVTDASAPSAPPTSPIKPVTRNYEGELNGIPCQVFLTWVQNDVLGILRRMDGKPLVWRLSGRLDSTGGLSLKAMQGYGDVAIIRAKRSEDSERWRGTVSFKDKLELPITFDKSP